MEPKKLTHLMISSVNNFTHVWYWNQRWPTEKLRKGLKCRILISGSKNSVMLEMEDGEMVITSIRAIREIKENKNYNTFFI